MPHVELPQAEFKVVMLGDTNTGKTSLVLRFAEGYYREEARSSTVGAFFITKRLQVQGITCKLSIWDTAGQEQFRCMAPMYYRNAAAAIVCYDVTNPKSYQTMRYWLDELHRNISAGSIVICIAATKTDLAPSANLEEAEQMAHEMGAMFVDTSAKTNTNVISLFQKVAERVLQFRQDTPIPVTPGAAIDSEGNVTKNATSTKTNRFGIVSPSQIVAPVTNVVAASPKLRRDKRAKQTEVAVGIEQAPSDVVESTASTAMCGMEHPYLCGQRDDGVESSCTIS